MTTDSRIGIRFSSGSAFEEKAGYARAVLLPDPGGDWILISGTTGYDYDTMTIASDIEQQTRQCFHNIRKALTEAGAGLEHLVRLRTLLADAADFDIVAPVLAEYAGPALPANTAIIVGFVDPGIRIEIEALARKPALLNPAPS